MLQTWEAIKELTNNNDLIFKVVKISEKLEEDYFMMVTYWCGKPFVRYFQVHSSNTEFSEKVDILVLKDGRKIFFFDAVPLSDNIGWIESKELEGLF